MTERPYTDDDLRAEAARLHAEFAREDDEGLVGEHMEDHRVPSVEADEDGSARTWSELLEPEGEGTPEYVAAQRAVCALIKGAANVSEWAINLGADGLEPTGHTVQLGVDPGDGDRPRVRLHFAFHPDMPDQDRDHFVMALSKVVLRNL